SHLRWGLPPSTPSISMRFGDLPKVGCTRLILFGSSLTFLIPVTISINLSGLWTIANLPPNFKRLEAALRTSSNVHITSWRAIALESLGFINPLPSFLYGGLETTTSHLALPSQFKSVRRSPCTMDILSSNIFNI